MLTVLELILLLVAPWRLWQLVLCRTFARSFPRITLKLIVALIAWLLLIVAVYLRALVLLGPLTATAVVAAAWDAWRGRDSSGRTRGLPPGSIAPLNLCMFVDQDYIKKQAARLGPVFKARWFMRPMVCVVGLERGLDLIRQAGDALVPTTYPFDRFVPGGFLRSFDVERHAKYRKIFQDIFSPHVVRNCEPAIASIVRDALETAAAESAAGPGEGVRVRLHLNRMLFSANVRLFFGVDPDSATRQRLKSLYRIVDIRNQSFASDRKISAAMREIVAIAHERIEHYRRPHVGGDKIPSCFLAEALNLSPECLSDPTVLGNLAMLMHTSWSDVAGLSQWLVKSLSDNPLWIARLREPPEPDTELGVRIVMETLRLEQSELLHRRVNKELSINGFTIPPGWLLRICVGESHRRPEIFENPNSFNPDRFRGRTFSRTEYMPFGTAPYACLGAALTMTLGRTLVTELSRGFDWTVTADGPPEFGSWCHWRPSSQFRIALVPRN